MNITEYVFHELIFEECKVIVFSWICFDKIRYSFDDYKTFVFS